MKVAALKKKHDHMNDPLESEDDEEIIGGDVPEMDKDGNTILDRRDSIASRTMYDRDEEKPEIRGGLYD